MAVGDVEELPGGEWLSDGQGLGDGEVFEPEGVPGDQQSAFGAQPGSSRPANSGGRSGTPGRAGSSGPDASGPGETPDGAPLPPPGATGKGFTAKTIFIGFLTVNDVAAFGRSLGAKGEDLPQDKVITAIVKDLNARGGIAGRTVKAVFHDTKAADLVADPSAAAEAACAGLTEDQEVFAATTTVTFDDETLASCFARHQTPLLHVGDVPRGKAVYPRFAPYLYTPGISPLEPVVGAMIRRGISNGYLSSWDTTAGAPGTAPAKDRPFRRVLHFLAGQAVYRRRQTGVGGPGFRSGSGV